MALVGGDVQLDGENLQAFGGRIELGGVAGSGMVGLSVNGNDLRLSFPDGIERADVSLIRSRVSVHSFDSPITNNDGFEESVPVIPAGIIAINARNIDILEGSYLDASTFNGKAGEIKLNATGAISAAGAAATESLPILPSILSADGTRGVINIKARSISLTRSILDTVDFGGNAGSISLQADDEVSLVNSDILSNIGYGEVAGEINIQARSISISDGSQVNAFGTLGISGNINIKADDDVSISSSSLNTFAEDGGRGGNIGVKAKSFSLNDGARLNAGTDGNATAGNIVVIADSVTLSGISSNGSSSGLFTSTNGYSTFFGQSGQGGDIRIDAGTLHISDGAVVSAITKSDGDGGNITVNTNTLELTGGGQLLTSAFSSGRAGDITVNATDNVVISGSDPTNALRVAQRFIGQPFHVDVDNDGAASGLLVRVRGNKAGNAGNIQVQTGGLRLDNEGIITAETTLGNGGNITLQARDILLRDRSNITATAGTSRAGGNGGNINIDTNLLVALENSDISANAFKGNGGKVEIRARGIEGTQFREQPTRESDITASSVSGGINGVVTINTPLVDPSLGLLALPAQVVEHEGLIATGCAASNGTTDSQFTVTGRGGLPPSPYDPLTSAPVWEDARFLTIAANPERSPHPPHATPPSGTAVVPIVPATGWVFNNLGLVTLTALAPNAPASIGSNRVPCHAAQQ